MRRCRFALVLAGLAPLTASWLAPLAPVAAQSATSRCLAIAENMNVPLRVAYRPGALAASEVRLTFVGHATFLIESPEGIQVATDYAGYAGPGVVPDAVTMNRAHSSHYTDHPDPAIAHVLRGWNPAGGYAEHDLDVGDMKIRNVPTNIRTWRGGGTDEFGNSIFIFETAGLCIGHLGHLHHELTVQQLGQVGYLDVVLAPVDGSYTLDLDGMAQVLQDLHARLVIPMHYFSAHTLERFLARMREDFTVRLSETATVVLSRADLPDRPEILVLPGY